MTDEYKPDLSRYRPKSITVDRLDQLADFVFAGNSPSSLGSIIAFFKLAVALAYIIARKQLVDGELLIEKQLYEQERNRKTDDDLSRDDLDARPSRNLF